MPTLWRSDELASKDFPTPAYLVDPMIPQGGIVLDHGKPGVGKTQFTMTLAHAINTGEPLFGRWEVRQGSVIIVQADMSTQIQQDRLLRIMQNNKLPDTYFVVEEDGSTPLLNILTMELQHRDLVKLMKEVDPVLCVWDTLRKVHDQPEAASETVVKVINAAKRILPHATHKFNHHDRKESRDPDAYAHEEEAFAGSHQWRGAIDTQIQLKEIGTSPKRLAIYFHKARTAPDPERAAPVIVEMDMDSMLLLPLRRRGTTGCASEFIRTS